MATRENEPVAENHAGDLAELVRRRMTGESVARIIGQREFYGLAFTLNSATLEPRPETELLVDLALGALPAGGRLLDLGTGTGCIPIAVLANQPDATAVAVDLSAEALAAAQDNAERHGVDGRITLLHGSWFEPLFTSPFGGEVDPPSGRVTGPSLAPGAEKAPSPAGSAVDLSPEGRGEESWFHPLSASSPHGEPVEPRGHGTTSPLGERSAAGRVRGPSSPSDLEKAPSPAGFAVDLSPRGRGEGFHLIVSNPPYIASPVIDTLAPEVRDFDPRLALDGGPDGLAPYRIIAAQAAAWLLPNGRVLVEIGHDQGAAVAALFLEAGYDDVEVHRDLSGLDRVVSAHHVPGK